MNKYPKADILALSYKILQENAAQNKLAGEADYTEMLKMLKQHTQMEEAAGETPTLQGLYNHIEDLHQRLQLYQSTGKFYARVTSVASNDGTLH